jgi:hypothetical protein
MLERKGTIALILGGFSYFLSDYLTWSTLIFVFFSVCTLAVGIKIPKPLRIISALVIVASYILVYGKIFDPEVGLNFLTSVVMLKVLESETDRDGYMVFFGLILLIAAGSIFEKSLEYTFFLFGGFSLLLASFHQGREIRWVKKEIVLTFILLIPLIAVLFFVVPRIVSPISLFRPQNQKGKIGYTKTVNMDEIESLTPSDEIAFYAVITGIVPRNELYWRGNVLTLTDGWNWIESSKTDGIHLRDEAFVFKGLKQEIYLSHSSEYFFMLDWPLTLRTELGDKRIGQTGTLSQKRTTKSYTVWSQKTSTKKIVGGVKSLTISGLKSQDKEWIKENFKAEGVSDLLEEIQAFQEIELCLHS